MPRNWRCANGHAWTGELGALTFCPDCGTADVYEVRPEYHSGEHPALKDAPPPPADDAFGRTFIQPAAAPAAGTGDTFIQMRPHAAGDTFVQAPPVAAGAGDTLMQPVLEVSTDEMLAAPPFDPADPGTTLIQAYVPFPRVEEPADEPVEKARAGDTFVQPPPRSPGPVADGGTIIQAAPGAAEPAAGGGTIIQAPAYPSHAATLDQPSPVGPVADGPTVIRPSARSPAAGETQAYQVTPVDGGTLPRAGGSVADTPTLDAPAAAAMLDGPSMATAAFPATVEGQRTAGRGTGTSGQDTRPTAPPPPRAKDPRGTPTVEGYEILGVLGRGGMGVVYKARQVGLNRTVALKMILAGGHAGAYERQRFKTEGEAVAALQHPNIVQVYDVGERDGLPYFSLEFCDGGSLQQKLGGQPLPPKLAADIGEQLARAMQYAHERGIVHRDLKPANILFAGEEAVAASASRAAASKDSKAASRDTKVMTKDSKVSRDATKDATQSRTVMSVTASRAGGSSATMRTPQTVPKVTDFGLAKKLEDDSGLTGSGTILGTPSYMAPEQAEGNTKSVGPPADIHALGAILYEMLTGRPPFLGSDVMDTMNQVRTMDPVPPTRIQPRTPKDLETICLKCLQKEIHKRYLSSGDMADDLRRFLDGEPIAARPVRAWEKAWKWAKRRPAQAGLIGVITAGLFGAAAGGVWFGQYKNRQAKVEEGLKLQAQEHTERAERNFRDARNAVRELLYRVGAERLSYVPQAEKLRAELLDRALDYCNRFLLVEGNDPSVRREAVWANLQVGFIRMQREDRPAAIAAYRKAIELHGPLTQANGAEADDTKDLLDLIEAQRLLTILFEADRKAAEADAAYEAARAGLRDLVAAQPGHPDFRLALAKLLTTRSVQLGERKRPAEAEAVVRLALDELEKLVRDHRNPDYVLEEARGRADLGAFLIQTGRAEAAVPELKRAITALTALVRQVPDVPEYASQLGRAYLNLGAALYQAGKQAEAVLANEEAVSILAKLVTEFPRTADFRYYLALVHDNIAYKRLAVKEPRAAEEQRAIARDLYRKLVAEAPGNAEYRRRYAINLDESAAFLASTDRLDQAIELQMQAVEVIRGLSAADPLNPAVVRECARRRLNLGQLYARARKLDEAQSEYAVAAAALEGQADRRLPDDDSWHDLPTVYMNQALLFQAIGREKPAERCWQSLAAVSVRLAAARPNQPDHLAGAALANYRLAKLHADKASVALAELKEAVSRQRAAVAMDRGRGDLAEMLGIFGPDLVDALLTKADHAAAAKACEELDLDLPPTWSGRPRLAGLVVRCIRDARTDTALSEDARQKAIKDYGEQALTLLRKAATAGFKDAAALRESPDLEVLRTDGAFRPAFERVLADVEANGKAGPK